jgi:NADH-quinone oxidoreductase subunit L
VLFYFTGTLTFSELPQHAHKLVGTWAPLGIGPFSIAGIAAVLLLIGATGKSAQIPLYVWLPDAMAGPTPVSALIHAATMVTAGVYMVARLNFLYMLSPMAMGLVALVGAATALYAATIGFAQNDIKKVLAYSTISQLGYMFMAVGVGAFAAGIFHLFTHAFFKACLFLCAGSVIHAMSGKQDIREMGGLAKRLPLTHWTFLLSTLAITGIPLWSGFFSKDEILWKAISQGNPAWPSWFPAMLYILGVLAALCTAFYMFRLYYLTFSGTCRADEETQHHIHESPWTMTMPLVILAFGATVLGFLGLPGLLGEHANLFATWLASTVEQGARLAATVQTPAVAPLSYAHDHALEGGLMALSVIIALVGWLMLARHYYLGGATGQIKALVRRMTGLHRLVLNKYWIDEVYNALVVQPVRWLARVLADAFDRFIIDILLVNGSAKIVDIAGQGLRQIQSGNVQRYVVALLVGLAVLIFVFAGSAASFSVNPDSMIKVGEIVTFEAETRPTVHRQLEYLWDFDGNGAWDTEWLTQPVVQHAYTQKGSYKVRLQMRDALHKDRVESGSMTLEVL